MRAWRIARKPHCEDRYGLGAKRVGGRWTPPGTPVIHAASTIALAALEVLVHARKPPPDLVLVAVDVPDDAPVDSPKISELPQDWRTPLLSAHCQAWGKAWCEKEAALALAVPSVIVPEERNFVINVSHRRMKDVRLKLMRPFVFDLRLLPAN